MSKTELTQDEYSVLLIASSGEYMMPIGRWEAPVEALVKRGLLYRHDKFNNTITEAGKKAIAAREKVDDRALEQAINNIAQARTLPVHPIAKPRFVQSALPQESVELYQSKAVLVDIAANALVMAAKSCEEWDSGHRGDREAILRQMAEVVSKRALDYL